MARPPEFDRSDVIKRAMNIFWRDGYGKTSISDLEMTTGLGRGSIYAAFAGKRGLFVESLRLYRNLELAEVISVLDRCSSGKVAIERRFAEVIKARDFEDSWFGCLMVNSIVELAGKDEELMAQLGSMRRELEDAYFSAVERGQKSGDISSAISARTWARHLTSLDMGLAVMLRSGASKEALRDSISVTLASLLA